MKLGGARPQHRAGVCPLVLRGRPNPMPTEPQPVTLAEVVHKAVEACSGNGREDALAELELRFEDDDRPITSVGDIEQLLDERLGSPEVEDLGPELAMARAVIVYLAYRRDELGEEPADLLRLAARAEFDGHPPPSIAQWLEQRGID